MKQEKKRILLLNMGQAVNLIGSWEWDLKTNEIFWTDEMFALRAAPVNAGNLVSLEETIHYIHHDDRDKVLQKFALAKQRNEVEFKYRIVAADGKVKYVAAWIKVVKDESGEPMLIRGTSQDISKQLEAQHHLHELNHVLNHAEEIAGLGSWQFNITRNQMVFSKNLYAVLGLERNETPSYNVLVKVVCKGDKNKFPSIDELAQQPAKSMSTEFRIRTEKGTLVYIRQISKHIKNKAEEDVVLATIQVITGEVLLRRELEERKVFSDLLFNNSIDMVVAYDKNLHVIAWNKTCEDYYGIGATEITGKHFSGVQEYLHQDTSRDDLEKALAGEYIHRTGNKRTDGAKHFEYFIQPLKTSDGEIKGALTITHDLTAISNATARLDELNRSLEQKNKELERSNNELASFSYVASHDLQEPLRKIQTFSRRIIDTELTNLSAQGKDYFKRMESAARRMQRLIEDLLTFSRTNTTLKTLEQADLNVILAEVKISLKEHIEEKGAIIESGQLPVAKVIVFQFRQMLENLILNSLKYAKPGQAPQIKITSEMFTGVPVQSEDPDAHGNYFKIDIMDNGIGFEQEFAEKIFELFQRLHGKHEYPGTGLGLAICRKIMQNHHGFISAHSEINQGATFTVYLPA